MQENETVQTKKHSKIINKTTIFGAILVIFAIIGIISSIVFVTDTTINIVDNKKGKQVFAEYISPLVVIDPPTFDSADKLDPKTVLTAAIWNLLKNEKLSKYKDTLDEFDFITVPATDVEAYAIKLFGDGLKFQHQPLGDANYSFEYNAEDKTYTIPSSNVYVPYTPKVAKIKRQKDIYRLTVEYLSSNNFIKNDKTKNTKTRIYVLKKIDKKNYNIIAIEDPAEEGTISSSVTTTSSAVTSSAVTSSALVSSATTSVATNTKVTPTKKTTKKETTKKKTTKKTSKNSTSKKK